MMQFRLGLILSLSVMSLAGCSSLAFKNGSLDYKNTTKLDPLEYPEGVISRPATPLYPVPTVEQLAIDNAPRLENSRGNRFALPRPEIIQAPISTNQTTQSTAVSRPQAVVDGNRNPLLKIDGDAASTWQYTLATLSSLNYTVKQSKTAYEATIRFEEQNYVLRLSSMGSSNTLAVFNADNTFADPNVAANVLTQIYQNWPA